MSRHRRAMLHAIAIVATLGIVAMLVVSSGIVSIAASSGHWPMMSWFLHYAARRSVATHARGVEVPPLDDAALISLGAVHYRLQCESCHGAPGVPTQPTKQSMTPPPPDLQSKVSEWKPRELYWIIQHGMKYTAMPAWPAQQRKDEAWALVAFLQTLPELDAQRYRELASMQEPASGRAFDVALAQCASCHGQYGEGEGVVPSLAGQSADYLAASLDAYASGQRLSGLMRPIATMLEPELRRALAKYYAALERPAPSRPGDDDSQAGAYRRGEALALRGAPQQGIPPCISCHGIEDAARHPRYPSLQGQPREYLRLQLHLLQQDQRGGSSYGHLMQAVAQRLDAEQVEDLIVYYGR